MNPLVSEMRTIYGRPKLEQIIEAGVTKNYGKIMFIVKRHPFKRLFSGKNLLPKDCNRDYGNTGCGVFKQGVQN